MPHGHSAGAGGSGRHSPALPALPRERWGTTGCLCLPHHGQTWLAPVSPQVVLGTGDTSLPAPVPVPGVPVWPSCQASSARQDPLPGLRWALSLARVWGGLTAPTALRTLPTWPAAPTQLLLMTTPYITMATGTEGTEGWGPGIPLQLSWGQGTQCCPPSAGQSFPCPSWSVPALDPNDGTHCEDPGQEKCSPHFQDNRIPTP